MDKSKIIDKIQKMLRLQSSAEQINSLEEAATVARKIQSLLVEYNLSMADIKDEQEEGKLFQVFKSDEWSAKDGNGRVWKYELLKVIADNNLCQAHLRHFSYQMFIVGREENVIATKQLYDYLLVAFRRLAKDRWQDRCNLIIKRFGELGRVFLDDSEKRKFLRSYYEGVPIGLKSNFDSRKQTSEVAALVVCHNKVIDEYMQSNFTFCNTRHKALSVDSTAYYMGMEDGENINLNKQINQ